MSKKNIKLNQIISIENQAKTQIQSELTEIHKATQKPDLFNGQARKFEPRDDDPSSPIGERLPDETKNITFNTQDVITKSAEKWARVFDLSATREWGNSGAKASVEVDGKVLIEDAPVGYLLYLEKKLEDIRKFVDVLPVLDPTEKWEEFDSQNKVYKTERTGQARNKPVTRAMVLYEATPQHPAQVKEVQENVFAGTWWTTKYSSALPAQRKSEILSRIQRTYEAVKFAREKANETEIEDKKVGKPFFDFLFG